MMERMMKQNIKDDDIVQQIKNGHSKSSQYFYLYLFVLPKFTKHICLIGLDSFK